MSYFPSRKSLMLELQFMFFLKTTIKKEVNDENESKKNNVCH